MISVAEALEKLFALAPAIEVETVPIRKAGGRVLAQAVEAKLTQPPFAASAMDGYAVFGSGAAPGGGAERRRALVGADLDPSERARFLAAWLEDEAAALRGFLARTEPGEQEGEEERDQQDRGDGEHG